MAWQQKDAKVMKRTTFWSLLLSPIFVLSFTVGTLYDLGVVHLTFPELLAACVAAVSSGLVVFHRQYSKWLACCSPMTCKIIAWLGR